MFRRCFEDKKKNVWTNYNELAYQEKVLHYPSSKICADDESDWKFSFMSSRMREVRALLPYLRTVIHCHTLQLATLVTFR